MNTDHMSDFDIENLELKENLLKKQKTNLETMRRAKSNLVTFYKRHIAKLLEMVSQFESIENMTIEQFMVGKKRMMTEQVILPVATYYCYFCIDVHKDRNINNLDNCAQCPYGNAYGTCRKLGSNFNHLSIARSNLLYRVHDYYYEPEFKGSLQTKENE